MRILMLSTDRSLFSAGSPARARIASYGAICKELHIIVFTTRKAVRAPKCEEIAENVFAYPTRSLSRWFYIFNAYRLGKTIIHKSKFLNHKSLITAQDPFECGLAGVLLARTAQAPLQLQVHTDFDNPFFVQESLLNRIRFYTARFTLPRADCIRVVSKRIYAALARGNWRLRCKPEVLPIQTALLTDTGSEVTGKELCPSCERLVVMVSRLTAEKDIPTALRALKEVHTTHPDTGLLVIGSGRERAALEKRARALGLSNRVFFLGERNPAPFYREADVYLLTSRYEGYGRTLIEAALARTPIVTTDVGIAGFTLKDAVHATVVPVGDFQALAAALRDVFDNPGTAQKRTTEAYRAAQEAMGTDYLEAFKAGLERCFDTK